MIRTNDMGGWIRAHAPSLAFYLYALLLAPPLARALKVALAGSEPVLWPGLLLLAVQILEPFGLHWKMRLLRRRNADSGFEPQNAMAGIFYAVGIGHVIVTVFMGMLALDAWGVLGVGADNVSGWWGAVIIALVVKELVAFAAGGGQEVAREAPGHWKETAGDACLLCYGAVAYTAWWGALLDLGGMEWNSLGERLALMPVFAGIFLFFYLPMRLPFLLEEFYLRQAAGRKARIWAELGIGAVLGLYPVLG
jgi:hypothetical protein